MPNQDIDDWNRAASAYAEGIAADTRFYDAVKPYLWESLGDLNGKRVLDVGAGDGWLSNELAMKGAEVLAIDGSTALIESAGKKYPEVKFIEHDLVQGLPSLGTNYDVITAFMVLMDLPEIQPLLNDAGQILDLDGCLIFVVLHPCFFNFKTVFDETTRTGFRKIDRYLKPETWRIDTFGGHNHYHRSITSYSEALREAGFVISRLVEPEHIPAKYDYDFYRDIPMLLYVEARRVDA